ncbi:MAG: peroxiredoxin [Kiritimatiellia bacterium]|jgi:peroxiredoxin
MANMLTRTIQTAVVLGSLLALAPTAFAEDATDTTAAVEGRSAAAKIELKDIKNKTVTLDSHKGKVVLVQFWSTTCGPCKVEMKHLQEMYSDFDGQPFEILSIATDPARRSMQAKMYFKSKRYTYTLLFDTQSEVITAYNPNKVLPYSVLVDKSGRVAQTYQGFNPGDELKLLAHVQEEVAREYIP